MGTRVNGNQSIHEQLFGRIFCCLFDDENAFRNASKFHINLVKSVWVQTSVYEIKAPFSQWTVILTDTCWQLVSNAFFSIALNSFERKVSTPNESFGCFVHLLNKEVSSNVHKHSIYIQIVNDYRSGRTET